MPLRKINYSRADLVDGLRLTGLCPGTHRLPSTVPSSTWGRSRVYRQSRKYVNSSFGDSEVIGPKGTMLLPAFSLSFYRNEDFDARTTRRFQEGEYFEVLGIFPSLDGVVRSDDPIFSVAGVDRRRGDSSHSCQVQLWKDCLHERLFQSGGKICGRGRPRRSAVLHYVEEGCGSLRYKKLFTGHIGRKRTKQTGVILTFRSRPQMDFPMELAWKS